MPQRKRSTATYLRRIGAKNLRDTFNQRMRGYEAVGWASRDTAKFSQIEFFGRLFLASFPHHFVGRGKNISLKVSNSKHESPAAITLFKRDNSGSVIAFQAKLGFGIGTVFIEAIQGASPKPNVNIAFETDSLNQGLGMPWPNFLLKKIEQHAKRLGFKRVFIHGPRTSMYFDMLIDLPSLSKADEAKIEARFQSLKKQVSANKNPQLSKEEKDAIEKALSRYA